MAKRIRCISRSREKRQRTKKDKYLTKYGYIQEWDKLLADYKKQKEKLSEDWKNNH